MFREAGGKVPVREFEGQDVPDESQRGIGQELSHPNHRYLGVGGRVQGFRIKGVHRIFRGGGIYRI